MVEKTRTLGFTTAFALGLGTMIAAGIFSLSGVAVAEVGGIAAVIAFVIAALVAATTAASYSEFASIYSESGGGYLFASRTFDSDLLVYVTGLMLFFGYSATTAFYLGTMGEWVHEFVLPIPPWVAGVATATLLGYLNAQGTEESGMFQIIVTGAKVAVLLAFIGGAFAYKPPGETASTFLASMQFDAVGILGIASMAFITFFGFSAIAASAGEIINPKKTVPKAIAASIITVTVLYAFVIVAMTNSPVPADVVAEQGETAMGLVANAFLGPIGMKLIVAGAIFSMVSASNASILAASRIAYLMGREGRAPRRFQNIHPTFGTPAWGVAACVGTIVALIGVFLGAFPAHGAAPFDLHLGLSALTGFANVNLLIPLSLVNIALVHSRRKFPDIARPFSVPLVPFIPVIGILANIALIASLPSMGIISASAVVGVGVLIYLLWGGATSVDDLMTPVSPDHETDITATLEEYEGNDEPFRVLIPLARAEDARDLTGLADTIGKWNDTPIVLDVVHVMGIPDQVPTDAAPTADFKRRLDAIQDEIGGSELHAEEITVNGVISQDVPFAILQAARDRDADLMLLGYPEQHRTIAEQIQRKTPCDVIYAHGADGSIAFDTINVGAGGGPNHKAALSFVNSFGQNGSDIHVINVTPEYSGTPETIQSTLDGLADTETVEIHNVETKNVASGLVDTAKENGGILVIGSSRDHIFRQWLFGSTPDHVVDLAEQNDIPVFIYRTSASVTGRLEDLVFVGYRFLRRLLP